LIITLLEAGLIRPHPLGFGIETSADGAIVGADGSIDRVLYTLGTPRKGDLWETTAIPEIRIQAAQMAADFIEWGRARPLLTALKNLPKLN
jgi:uncharacterized NAD(P)/FAD-binding protein YdhS